MSRVKIVATIGPRTNTVAAIRALRDAGMDVARLNGSHGDLGWHAETIGAIRGVDSEIPILLDIPGRKIRTRDLMHPPSFGVGDTIVLTTEEGHDGSRKVPVTSADLHENLSEGAVILADDGTLRFTVRRVSGRDIVCRAETAGTLKSAKGINVPGAVFAVKSLTNRDAVMLTFAMRHAIDFVGLSFVESARQIQAVRELIGKPSPRVLAKVENLDAMNNLEEVIGAADVIMIDRGDLSAETSLESIALFQKRILRAAHAAGKPAIVATEMLHSMIDSPVPTKAEVSDISNAVLDGAAALMLSGETAMGRFPTEAVAMMRRVADTVSASMQSSLDLENGARSARVPEAMGDAIALVCRRLPVTKVVAITVSGYAARMLAARAPRQPILAVSNDPVTARSMNILFGTEGVWVDVPFSRTSTDHIAACLRELWCRGKLVDEDLVLVTSVAYPRSGNRMNVIQMHRVADLRESQGWVR